jgi:hypothetical protein
MSCLALLLSAPVLSYGPLGHETVGAIADARLAGTPTGAEVTKLLDGLTLSQAAVLPDVIKGWDRLSPGQPKSVILKDHPKLQEQLAAFWDANPPTKAPGSDAPTHKEFHYTDVPAVDGATYVKGGIGTEPYDIVQMIPYCVRVLSGEVPESNERKITKPVALILLAHYVGDIHQPLHVGAGYFSADGKWVNPTKGSKYFDDHGGNGFNLVLGDGKGDSKGDAGKDSADAGDAKSAGKGKKSGKGVNLHGFWDTDAVIEAMKQADKKVEAKSKGAGKATDAEVVAWFAKDEPKGWKPRDGSAPTEWSVAWANEILPLAAQAHNRLQFSKVVIKGESASGEADERKMPDGLSYRAWAGQKTEEQLHKAGWRLAAIIEASLAPKKVTAK